MKHDAKKQNRLKQNSLSVSGWTYYYHAAVPTCALYEDPDISPIEDGSIWKMKNSPILARWTSEFDCGYETEWWYVIKDTSFNINELKAKRRYEITKGCRNFNVHRIDTGEYSDSICDVAEMAYAEYPGAYRPKIDRKTFCLWFSDKSKYTVYGAFDVNGELQAYAVLRLNEKHIDFAMLKSNPACEKQGVNAAIMFYILQDMDVELQKGVFICDGSRNIYHETAFQDYLEKYFGFRKAYCKLHIRYKKGVRIIVNILYPFRKLLKVFDSIGFCHKVNGVLKMHEIARTFDE